MNAPTRQPVLDDKLTGSIIGGFYAVHQALGCGFLEHVYAAVLEIELASRGHHVAREMLVPIHYHGKLAAYQRIDMMVDERVIVEISAAEHPPAAAERQLCNHLRCTKLELGLLLHFGREPKFERLTQSNTHKPAQFKTADLAHRPRII